MGRGTESPWATVGRSWWTEQAGQGMSRAGVPADHAERAIGHAIGGIRGIYDRHAYEAEKRAAFEALARMVENPRVRPPAVVVSFFSAETRRQ